jgi:peptidyl-prolyl cis-trans isomerase D
VKLSHIQIMAPRDASAGEKANALMTAQEIHAEVMQSNADLTAIARARTQNVQVAEGILHQGDQLPDELALVVSSLPINDISGVIPTRAGYEIVKVLDRIPGQHRGFDEVKGQIAEQSRARKRFAKRARVMEEIRSQAKIEQLLDVGRWLIRPAYDS